jgi:citrate lyase beta subunit
MRSLLYVPASRPRMLGKIPRVEADAVVVDLEDGVAPPEKEQAREHLRRAADQGVLKSAGSWMLRLNGPATRWHGADRELAAELRPPWIVLPKAEDRAAVAAAARWCEGWDGRLALMIETVRGVSEARALAGAAPAVGVLIYGSADYRLSVGARPDRARRWERGALHEILLAARLHDCAAVDSVYFRFRDTRGLTRHARTAREMGFDGKSCIHPSQVPVIHEVFDSSPKELAWAASTKRAWIEQDGPSTGVVVADGEMIEELHVRLADRILARAPGRRRPEPSG